MIFTIVNKEILEAQLPSVVIEYMNYEPDSTLKEKALVCSELEDGSFAVSLNLKAPGKQSAWTDLSSNEIGLAKQLYGEENFLTVEEYKQLNFKTVII